MRIFTPVPYLTMVIFPPLADYSTLPFNGCHFPHTPWIPVVGRTRAATYGKATLYAIRSRWARSLLRYKVTCSKNGDIMTFVVGKQNRGFGQSLAFSISSDPSLVHPIIQSAEQFARDLGVQDASRISVLLCELLSNAITHGNLSNRTRIVRCRIEHLVAGRFKIVVEDEGEGFDYARLNTSLPEDPRSIQRRGYVLIRRICSGLEFNQRGNRVTAYFDTAQDLLASNADGGAYPEGGEADRRP